MWTKILSLGAPKTRLSPPLFIEMTVPSYKSERMHDLAWDRRFNIK
jgi:hypothetical protein